MQSRRLFLTSLLSLGSILLYAQNGPVLIGSGLYRTQNQTIAIAPGQMITLRLTHLQTLLDGQGSNLRLANAGPIPLPTQFHGISVTLTQVLSSSSMSYQLPIYALLQIETCTPNAIPARPPMNGNVPDCFTSYLTVQIPYNIGLRHGAGQSVPSFLTITENNVVSEYFPVTPMAAKISLLTTCDAPAIQPPGVICTPLVNHQDGSLVTIDSPAAAGELITLHAWGLGVPIGLDPPPPLGSPALALNASNFRVTFHFGANKPVPPKDPANTGHTPVSVALTPDVGSYDIQVRLPKTFPSTVEACPFAGETNLTIVLAAVAGSFDGIGICVVPPPQ